jgi:hypothetical protein
MIFSCGETYEVKHARQQSAIKRLKQWHDFFPLVPRTVGEENGCHVCAWLQTIQRKGYLHIGFEIDWWSWEYRVKT